MWPDVAKFCHFGKILKSLDLAKIWVYFGNFLYVCANVHFCKIPSIKETIWSHCYLGCNDLFPMSTLCGQWWSRGRHAYLLLWQFKFESRWSIYKVFAVKLPEQNQNLKHKMPSMALIKTTLPALVAFQFFF